MDSRPLFRSQRRLPKEEIARRGDEIFARSIQPTLSAEDHGKYVAIDVETGDYEVAADEMTASDRLRGRRPDAQTWLLRVGYRAVRRYRSPRLRGLRSGDSQQSDAAFRSDSRQARP